MGCIHVQPAHIINMLVSLQHRWILFRLSRLQSWLASRREFLGQRPVPPSSFEPGIFGRSCHFEDVLFWEIKKGYLFGKTVCKKTEGLGKKRKFLRKKNMFIKTSSLRKRKLDIKKLGCADRDERMSNG